MIIRALVSKEPYREGIKSLIDKIHLKCDFCDDIESFFEKSLLECPRIFILQDDFDLKLRMFDLVRDLRVLFGSSPTIFLVGEQNYGEETAHFIGQGVNNILDFPFDIPLLEDLISKGIKNTICRPFKYRNVPSGGSPVKLKFDVSLTQISANGLTFSSKNFLPKGSSLFTKIDTFLNITDCNVRIKIIQNKRVENGYEYFGQFYDLETDLKKKIIHNLKLGNKHNKNSM